MIGHGIALLSGLTLALELSSTAQPEQPVGLVVLEHHLKTDSVGHDLSADEQQQWVERGLARAGFESKPLPTCTAETNPCGPKANDDVERWVTIDLSSDGPDAILSLTAYDFESGRQLASTEAVCEICGKRELQQTLADLAGSLALELQKTPITSNAPESQSDRPNGQRLLGTGIALLVAGAAGVSAGGIIWSFDGKPHERTCRSQDVDASGQCPNLHETTAAAATMVGLGAASMVAGAVLTTLGVRQRRASNVSLAVGWGQVVVGGRF